jgi:hypothetical protein
MCWKLTTAFVVAIFSVLVAYSQNRTINVSFGAAKMIFQQDAIGPYTNKGVGPLLNVGFSAAKPRWQHSIEGVIASAKLRVDVPNTPKVQFRYFNVQYSFVFMLPKPAWASIFFGSMISARAVVSSSQDRTSGIAAAGIHLYGKISRPVFKTSTIEFSVATPAFNLILHRGYSLANTVESEWMSFGRFRGYQAAMALYSPLGPRTTSIIACDWNYFRHVSAEESRVLVQLFRMGLLFKMGA